jgi:hypothetical protein
MLETCLQSGMRESRKNGIMARLRDIRQVGQASNLMHSFYPRKKGRQTAFSGWLRLANRKSNAHYSRQRDLNIIPNETRVHRTGADRLRHVARWFISNGFEETPGSGNLQPMEAIRVIFPIIPAKRRYGKCNRAIRD